MRPPSKLLLSLWVSLLAFISGCQYRPGPPPLESRPFQFDPKKVSELTLAKSDPETGDPSESLWISTLRRTESGWEILSSPQSQPILDPLADDTFILHLLDTFRSIQVLEPQPTRALLGEFSPPRFAVKWSTSGSEPSENKSYEFFLGPKLPHRTDYIFGLDKQQPCIAQGSAFDMLQQIKSFQFLRKRTWTSVHPDDIDEMWIRSKGKPRFYAQREGTTWTDQKHRPALLRIGTPEALAQQVMSEPINSFIDQPQLSQSLKSFVQDKPLIEFRFSNRFQKITSLKVRPKANILYGFSSSRPASVFVLNSKFLKTLRMIP